jgi:hypothetical protein
VSDPKGLNTRLSHLPEDHRSPRRDMVTFDARRRGTETKIVFIHSVLPLFHQSDTSGDFLKALLALCGGED